MRNFMSSARWIVRAVSLVAALTVMAGQSHADRELRSYTKDKLFDDLTHAEHTAVKTEARNRKIKRLRVCADPGNMPQSNDKREGYQNKIIELIAADLGATVDYFWRPYHERGLTRETFQNDECDLLLDMPVELQSLLTSEPMYRTAYVMAYRNDRNFKFENLDDPKLKGLRVGVFQHSGIREVLVRRGYKNLALHVIAYNTDIIEANQPWKQVEQVVAGQLDVAAVWGPFAGWLPKMKGAPLTIQPVNMWDDQVPLEFDLAIGMLRNNVLLKYMIDWSLTRKAKEIEAVLKDYGVPLVRCSKCAVDGDIPSNGAIYKRLRNVSQDRFLKEAPPMALSADATPDQRVTTERLEEWLKDGADLNVELANAVNAHSEERVRLLLDRGADPNMRDNQGYAPIHHAARNRYASLVALLADRGADVNARDSDGFTALLHAINRNHVPTIEMIAKKGGDLEAATTQGITPLTWAIGDGKYFAAKALIDAGAKVDSASGKEGVSPLMTAATQIPPKSRTSALTLGPPPNDLALAIIAKGANVNQTSKDGVTALMVAAGHNNTAIVGLLLNAGADPALKNTEGLTASQIAERAQFDNVVGALRLLGKDSGSAGAKNSGDPAVGTVQN
jgi:quinoprotein dehydrogenase-associated probable ABC transporter substrate-binding protein